MIELHAEVLHFKLPYAFKIIGRAETGVGEEIAEEVRLVEVPKVHRQLSPIRCGPCVHLVEHPLKSHNAVEEVSRQSHLGPEKVDEIASG